MLLIRSAIVPGSETLMTGVIAGEVAVLSQAAFLIVTAGWVVDSFEVAHLERLGEICGLTSRLVLQPLSTMHMELTDSRWCRCDVSCKDPHWFSARFDDKLFGDSVPRSR
jgi:hypothetical protein